MIDDNETRLLILDMFKNPSERDKQKKIGPSSIGNPCDYCLANQLLGTGGKMGQYWLGAVLGTAMHALLQETAENADTSNYRFAPLKGSLVEQKFDIGRLQGYGTIRGTVDLYIPGRIVDYKSTTKTKVARYKLDGPAHQYVVQQSLYAWGINKTRLYEPVKRISLAFVNRDGSGDNDVWLYSWDYDEGVALQAWKRLEKLWTFVSNGGNVEDLASDNNCYHCNRIIHRI